MGRGREFSHDVFTCHAYELYRIASLDHIAAAKLCSELLLQSWKAQYAHGQDAGTSFPRQTADSGHLLCRSPHDCKKACPESQTFSLMTSHHHGDQLI